MNPPHQSGNGAAHPPDADQLLERFEAAWKKGPAPALEDFVPHNPNDLTGAKLLRELIRIDLDHRWRQASPVVERWSVEEYLKRWPELARASGVVLELVREEYWARCCWGTASGHGEYATRFPQHRAELPKLLAAVDAEVADELAPSPPPAPPSLAVVPARAVPPPVGLVSSAGGLVDLLRHCQLLKPEQLEQLTRKPLALPPGSMALARDLLKRGWLTPYQANQLIPGKVSELVLGPYVLLERLGAGGMGQVFKARHRGMDRVVALKIIRRDLLMDEEVVRRFYREIQLVSRLDHPNVVHAYDAGPAGATHFLAMEFVEGIDLGKLVKQGGPLPVLQACEHIRQAALGLQHAHERGLVHRDIKPHNLLIADCDSLARRASEGAGPDPRLRVGLTNPHSAIVKVADLGLARLPRAVDGEATAALTGANTTGTLTPEHAGLMGTADYLAPEQALDFHNADIRSDIYSLGCTFYFLLTGRPPFPGGNLAQKVAKHLQTEPPAIEEFRTDVPPALAGVLRQMLAKRPEDRCQTPAEVAEKLQTLMAGRALPSGPVALASREQPTVRRRRRLPLLAGAAVLAASAFIFVFGWWRSSALPREDCRAELQDLQRRAAASPVDADGLRHDVLRFRTRYPGTPEAFQAANLLRQLPSPLDVLDGTNIPTPERFAWQPKELVAVLGEHRWRPWGAGFGHFGLGQGAIRCAVVSSDGKLLATGGDDGLVRVWDLGTRRLRFALKGHAAGFRALAFAPDGSTLASGSADGSVQLWDVVEGRSRQALTAHDGECRAVAFAPDSQMLASAGQDEAVKLWPLGADRKVLEQRPAPLMGHKGPINALAFHPGGKRLASAGEDRVVKVWLLDTGKEPANLPGHSGTIYALAYTPDSQLLISAGAREKQGGEIKIWDALRGWHQNTRQTTVPVHALALAPDGKTMAFAASTGLDRDVRFHEVSTWKEQTPLKRLWQVSALAYVPGSRSLVTAGLAGSLVACDLATQREVPLVDRRGSTLYAVAISPDCKTVATAGGWWDQPELDQWAPELRLWDVATGKIVRAFRGHRSPVLAVAFAPDGSTLAAADFDGLVRLWDPATGEVRRILKVKDPRGHRSIFSMCLAYSPDGKRLATGDSIPTVDVGTVKCWDVDTGTEVHVFAGPAQGVTCVAFSPDGKTLASSGDEGTVKLWDLAADKEKATLEGRGTHLSSLTYSADGQALLIGSLDLLSIWDVARNKERSRFATVAQSAAWLDGRLPISLDLGGRLSVWDEPSSRKIHEVRQFGPIRAADLAGDGRHLAVANTNGTVYILDLRAVAANK
jgi:eukaryotic-like serine/threonine-protein kinase